MRPAQKAFAVHAIIEARFVGLQNLLATVRKDYNERLANGEAVDAIRARIREIENRIVFTQRLVTYSEKKLRESAEAQNNESEPSPVRFERPQHRDRYLTLVEKASVSSRPDAAAALQGVAITLAAQRGQQ